MIRLAARAALVTAALIALVAFGLTWTVPPNAVGAGAPATEFSSARARRTIEAIARAPHPIGSPEHARVREHLLGELRELGLEPVVQKALSVRERYRPLRFAFVENILGRARGATEHTKAVLVMAHYDSRGMAPGASDDGFGAGALLETARALLAGPKLARDVIFLLSDAEEEGLLGATAFAEQHPWARDVAVVLNLDARGDAGPALMFQTGDESAALVDLLAQKAPHVAANSLSQAIYRVMPNDTDLSVFLPQTPSLNFANVEGFERYHAPTDTPANLDERTLQQGGEQVLAIARALANAPELPAARANPTYFNVGPLVVRYSAKLDLPLVAAAIGLTVAFLVLAQRRGILSARRVAVGVAAALGLGIASAITCFAAYGIAQRLDPSYRLMNAARPAVKALWFAAFLFLPLGLVTGVLARGKTRPLELFAGALVVFTIFAAGTALGLAGASFIFAWPATIAAGAALFATMARSQAGVDHPVTALVAASPALVVTAPFVQQLYVAFGPMTGPVIGLLVAWIASLCALAFAQIDARALRYVAAALLVAGLGAAVKAKLTPLFDAAHPEPDTVFYAVDPTAKRAFWVTPDPKAPDWSRTVFDAAPASTDAFPYPLDATIAASAPLAEVAAPELTWDDDAGQETTLAVRVPDACELLALRVEGATRVELEGRALPLERGVASAWVFGRPGSGIVLLKALRDAHNPMRARVATRAHGFPAGLSPGERPADHMPKPGMLPPWSLLLESDTTVVAVSMTH